MRSSLAGLELLVSHPFPLASVAPLQRFFSDSQTFSLPPPPLSSSASCLVLSALNRHPSPSHTALPHQNSPPPYAPALPRACWHPQGNSFGAFHLFSPSFPAAAYAQPMPAPPLVTLPYSVLCPVHPLVPHSGCSWPLPIHHMLSFGCLWPSSHGWGLSYRHMMPLNCIDLLSSTSRSNPPRRPTPFYPLSGNSVMGPLIRIPQLKPHTLLRPSGTKPLSCRTSRRPLRFASRAIGTAKRSSKWIVRDNVRRVGFYVSKPPCLSMQAEHVNLVVRGQANFPCSDAQNSAYVALNDASGPRMMQANAKSKLLLRHEIYRLVAGTQRSNFASANKRQAE